MAVEALAPRRVALRPQIRVQLRSLGMPLEYFLVWAGAFAFYIALAAYFVLHLHFMINDAATRVDNAFDVLFSRDPHLGAIGFVWPPLPSFLQLPILAFKGIWPALAKQGFAGSIEASAFSAATVAVMNSGLRWAGVVRGMRAVICLIWMLNPMVVIYATQGMSEAEFIFFFVASIVVFLRWCDSRKTALLPLAGILVGCAALCRVEAVLIVLVMGYGVVMQAIQNRSGWRDVETKAVLFFLPALLMLGFWVVTAAILFHDPLYVLHAYGFATGGKGVSAGQVVLPVKPSVSAKAYGVVSSGSWQEATRVVFTHMLDLFPAFVVLVVLLGVQIVLKQGRVVRSMLLALGLTIPAFDILVQRVGSSPLLRYQIEVLPFTFLMAVLVLRSVRTRRGFYSSLVALGMAVLLAVSSLITAQTLANRKLSEEEAPIMRAFQTGRPVQPAGDYGALSAAPRINAQLLRLDWDHGTILCDSATCFALNLTAPDPKLFVVTSDRDFEAAAADPLAYHVEYFLVPEPAGAGAIDRLNGLYPNLWRTGAGFATLIGEGSGGGPEENWRLYRINGPTGRVLRIPR